MSPLQGRTTSDAADLKEHTGLLAGAAGLMVAGFLTTFLSPLLAVSFSTEFEFGIEPAGLLVALGQGGVAFSAFGSLPFLPRLDRKKVGIVGASIAAVSLAGTGFATGFATVLVLQFLMGIGAGLCYACANSALAYARFPERGFSIVTISWMLVGALMLTLGPSLHDIWPKAGIYLAMAAAELLCVTVIVRLPDVRALPEDDPQQAQPSEQAQSTGVVPDAVAVKIGRPKHVLTPGVILITAMFLMQTGNIMIWTFAESIGEQAGLTAQYTSTFLGLSQLMGLIGAGITLMLGAKVSKIALAGPSVIALAVGNLLVGTAVTPEPFMLGFLAINLAFFCLVPLLLALAAELDTSSGRLVVLVGGVALLAGAVAPALGGWIAGHSGHWSRLGTIAMALVLLALPLLAIPIRAANRRAKLAGEL